MIFKSGASSILLNVVFVGVVADRSYRVFLVVVVFLFVFLFCVGSLSGLFIRIFHYINKNMHHMHHFVIKKKHV